jgi:hypothetical protein
MNKKALIAIITCCLLAPKGMQAQLSTNPDKFLGNITTKNDNMDVVQEYFDNNRKSKNYIDFKVEDSTNVVSLGPE